jgi:hypothetical protein
MIDGKRIVSTLISHRLVDNNPNRRKIILSKEGDGGFAVVYVDNYRRGS